VVEDKSNILIGENLDAQEVAHRPFFGGPIRGGGEYKD
jgi:hypothetical protein